ncbi:MAG: DMT family transporter [Flavobacteriales bacterium]|nr:DMT family transporter [Flavobacteriales bacterium]
MYFLLLSICFSSILFVIFRYFDKFKVDNFTAIVVNYLVAFGVGFLLNSNPSSFDAKTQPWFYSSMVLGLLFIFLFGILARVTQEKGITTSVVSNKMSMILPVLAAFVFLGDTPNWLKIMGICIAIPGIILTVIKKGTLLKNYMGLPLFLFLGSGILDFSLKLNQMYLVDDDQFLSFVSYIFLFAFVAGAGYGTFHKTLVWHQKNIVAGIILGVPNYFSIYFLMEALNFEGIESTTIFPINNAGVLVMSSLLSVLIFKEKLSITNTIGMLLCVVSIAIISLA